MKEKGNSKSLELKKKLVKEKLKSKLKLKNLKEKAESQTNLEKENK
jgi:hypothetical protein